MACADPALDSQTLTAYTGPILAFQNSKHHFWPIFYSVYLPRLWYNGHQVTQMIKVLIVEDEGLFRDMLAASLSQQPTFHVVEAVAAGASAVLAARRHHPNVVVTDIELGSEPHGIEAAHLIRKENPQTGIVILSSHKDTEYIASVPVDKASGWSYLLKQSVGDVSALVRAIEGSADGFMVLDPAVVEGLRAQPGSPLSRLTRRQHEVIALMAQG